jgi:hypothetical protein
MATSCNLAKLNVKVYKRSVAVGGGAVQTNYDGVVGAPIDWRSSGGRATIIAGLADELIHVCLEDYCEYLPCAGPHEISYPRDDVFVFENLFVCSESANIHACGARCTQRYTTGALNGSGEHTCPISGMVLGAQMDNSMYGTGPLAPQITSEVPTNTRRMAGWLAAETDAARRVAMAQEVFEDLIYSRTRFAEEILKFETANVNALKDAQKAIFAVDQPRSRDILAIYMRRRPHDHFFVRVHNYRIRATRACMSASTGNAALLSARERNNARIRELIIGCASPTPMPSLDVAPVAVGALVEKVYDNLKKNEDKIGCALPPFATIFVHIMYMMRDGYKLPLNEQLSTARAMNIYVIPRVEIMRHLPPQSTLKTYDTINKYVNKIDLTADPFKAIARMFIAIRDANKGSLMDIEINLDNFYILYTMYYIHM